MISRHCHCWAAIIFPVIIGFRYAVGADIRTSDEFLTALADPSVSLVHILNDLHLSDAFPTWQALQQDIQIGRNVTIYGSPGTYPVIDCNWWGMPGFGQRSGIAMQWNLGVQHGINLGPHVVLVFAHVMLKRVFTLIPDFVFRVDATARIVLYDCIKHVYTGAPPSLVTGILDTTPRPAAEPGTNQLAGLDGGFCRVGPAPALCWDSGYMIVDMAWDQGAFLRDAAHFPSAIELMYGVMVVYEEEVSATCYEQYYAGNATCLSTASRQLQEQEALSPTGWLKPAATQAQLQAGAQAFASAPPIPDTPYVPDWLLVGWSNQSGRLTSRQVLGLAVGLSIGVPLLLAILAGSIWYYRHKRASTPAPDMESGGAADKASKHAPQGAAAMTSTSAEHKGKTTGIGGGTPETVQASTGQEEPDGAVAACTDGAEKGAQPGQAEQLQATDSSVLSFQHTTKETSTDAFSALHSSLTTGSYWEHATPQPQGSTSSCGPGEVLQLNQVITDSSPLDPCLNLQVNLQEDVQLGAVLGTGAMGTVYKAAYRGLQVAVKVFLQNADLASFQHEIRVLGRTSHSNVVGLLGACFIPHQVALLEELCDGSLEQLMYGGQPGYGGPPIHIGDAARCMREAGGSTPAAPASNLPKVPKPLPLSMVLSIALDMANGLAYLHPTVIHRDLKPANILLVYRPPSHLQAKISDFGLSRMRDAMTIITEKPYCGTVPYMAPECFSRQKEAGLTHKCDIYSFGMVLWEMLHGVVPWAGYAPAEVLFQVAVSNARPPLMLTEDRCPAQLSKLIVRCWDRDPWRRPPALEIARELAFLQRQLGLQPAH